MFRNRNRFIEPGFFDTGWIEAEAFEDFPHCGFKVMRCTRSSDDCLDGVLQIAVHPHPSFLEPTPVVHRWRFTPIIKGGTNDTNLLFVRVPVTLRQGQLI